MREPPTDALSAHLFEWVVEHADDGYAALAGDGRIMYANGKARADLKLGKGKPHFWSAAAVGHAVVGDPAADGPVYLLRPEAGEATGIWFRADRFAVPSAAGRHTVVRLRDVTDERRMRQSLWAYRATQKYGLKLKVPKGGVLAQAARAAGSTRTKRRCSMAECPSIRSPLKPRCREWFHGRSGSHNCRIRKSW